MTVASRATGSTPAWLAAEMPPGYQNRLAEIQRLTDELRAMDRFGRLLWCVGDELAEAVGDAFAALGFETDLPAGTASVVVKLSGRRRLLLYASGARAVIQRKSAELAHAFRMVHELAEEGDRVVLVTNGDSLVRPAERIEYVSAEAMNLIRRLGVNIVSGPTVFALWMLLLESKDRAHAQIERLHAQDGGEFVLSTIGGR